MIAAGHAAADVWAMSPRALRVWLVLARKRRRTELAELLQIAALGAQGQSSDIKEQIEILQNA